MFTGDSAGFLSTWQRVRGRCYGVELGQSRVRRHAGAIARAAATSTTAASACCDTHERQLPGGGHWLQHFANNIAAESRDGHSHDFKRKRGGSWI